MGKIRNNRNFRIIGQGIIRKALFEEIMIFSELLDKTFFLCLGLFRRVGKYIFLELLYNTKIQKP